MLDSLFAITSGGQSLSRIQAADLITRMLVAIAFGLAMSFLHGLLHRRMGKKPKFQWALAVLPLISGTVILVIGNNLVRAFGLIGAVAHGYFFGAFCNDAFLVSEEQLDLSLTFDPLRSFTAAALRLEF